MTAEDALRLTNRNMIAFDLVWLAGAANLAMALGFGWLSRRS